MVRSVTSTLAHKPKIGQQKINKNVINSRVSLPDLRKLKVDSPLAPGLSSSLTSSHFNNASCAPQKKRRISLTASNVTKFHEDSETELDETSKLNRAANSGVPRDDDMSSASTRGDKDTDDESENSWLNGSTLIAQYADEEYDTPEERAAALVEYLQVPFQEKGQELKRDLCNSLMTTLNEIRLAHLKIDQGPDVDRAKGIIRFTDICQKRHVDMSQLQAEFLEDDTEKQLEINKLFAQLRQTYDARKQLWTDFEARIEDLTSKQTAVLEQLEDNIAQAIERLDKKYKNMFKEYAGKDKSRLVHSVLKRV